LVQDAKQVVANERFFAAAAVKSPHDERAETPSATTAGCFHAAMALASSMVTQNDSSGRAMAFASTVERKSRK